MDSDAVRRTTTAGQRCVSCIPGTFVAGVFQPIRSMNASPEVDRDAGRTPELDIVLNLCTVGLHMLHIVGARFSPLLLYLVKGPPPIVPANSSQNTKLRAPDLDKDEGSQKKMSLQDGLELS